MIDKFFRFSDQATMLSALRLLGMTYTTEEPVEMVSQGGHQYACHEVGEISGVEGHHYNLRLIDENFDVSSLEEYQVFPKNPKCQWA